MRFELVPAPEAQKLVARKTGAFDIEVQYETRVASEKGENGFALPTPAGLIGQLNLTVANLDVDVVSPPGGFGAMRPRRQQHRGDIGLDTVADVDRLEAAPARCD